MKYLKKFNESLDNSRIIKEYCEQYLAYLLDDGFNIDVSKQQRFLGDDNRYKINIYKIGKIYTGDGYIPFYNIYYWDDVKDILIPFLSLLNNNYMIIDDILSINTRSYYSNTTNINTLSNFDFKIDNVLKNENIINDYIKSKNENITIISFYLKNPNSTY